MPKSDTYFKKGNAGSGTGGRPKKPDWLKGKGEDALKVAYNIMLDETTKPETKLQACKLIAEFDLGKPRQQMDLTAELGAETRKTISLEQRKAALAEAVKLLDKV